MNGLRSKFLDCRCPIDFSHPLNGGLVADWTVSPLSGWRGSKTLRDLVRGGKPAQDGTLHGPTWPGSSRTGGYGALSFNGSSQYVDGIPSLSFGADDFTVACWLKVTSTSGFQVLVGKDTSGNRDWNLGLSASTIGMLSWSDFADSTTVESTTAIVAGAWTFAVATRRAGSMNLYLQGKDAGLVVSTGSGIVSGTYSATNAINLARREFSGFEQYFGGQLDGVQIYNRGLSPGEVRTLYQETRRGNPERWRWLRLFTAFSPPVIAGFPVPGLVTWNELHPCNIFE